ncbi:unnamed protein product [Cochlearia groenlandica]
MSESSRKGNTIFVWLERDIDIPNYDRITVSQLLDVVQSSDHQEKEVICRAIIVNIGTRNGWSYISCGMCSKKLVRGFNSFSCVACSNTNALGVIKFRVVLEVSAEGATTNFVLFDRDVRSLTNRTSEEISSSDVTALPFIPQQLSVRSVGNNSGEVETDQPSVQHTQEVTENDVTNVGE